MLESIKSADGEDIKVGDHVWVPTSDGLVWRWEKHVVGKLHEKKIEYDDPEPDGYLGAKLTIVYKKHPRQIVAEALALINSMILSGEQHSEKSRAAFNLAMKVIDEA
jgi:hypothetical protein